MSSVIDDTSPTSETGNFCPWASHFVPLTTDNLSGWVSSCSRAEEVRKIFEAAKSIHFIGFRKGSFGTHDETCPTNLTSHLVRFVDHNDGIIPFDGVPFMLLSSYTLGCAYGKDKHLYAKKQEEIKMANELMGDHPRAKKRRKRLQKSKKQNCPATMKMKEVIRFPQFKSAVQKKWDCAEQSRQLRRALRDGREIELERRVYISFPPDDAHNSHHIGEVSSDTSRGSRLYSVNLSSASAMPSCECQDGLRSRLPVEGMSWQNLPLRYHESPFDKDVVISVPVTSSSSPSIEESPQKDHNTHVDEQQPPSSLRKKVAMSCREKLLLLRDMTYLIREEAVLEKMEAELQSALTHMQQCLTIEGNLKGNVTVPKPAKRKQPGGS